MIRQSIARCLAATITAALLGLFALSPAHAQVVANSTYRLVPSTVYEARPVTVYRLHEEKVVQQRPVTTYKTETVTEMRERKYRVAKPVVETSERVQRYKVMKPVTETSMREESNEVTTYKTETRWREERRTVMKPMVETSERQERRTVMRPVTEREMREESYTSYRPVTRRELQWKDQSSYVDVPQMTQQGPARNRLRWMPRTNYVNPQTGLGTTQRAGFYWVPEQNQRLSVQRYFVPSFVPEEVERTSYEPETVTRRVPVERTRYEEVEQTRTVPTKTYRQVAEEQFRYVPETVRKPVTRTVTRKVPVTTTRWVEQEVVRRIPIKTYRMEYEDRVEQVPVQVQRTVPIQTMVEHERTIRRYLPEEREQIVAKTVMAREWIADDACTTVMGPTTVGRPVTSDPYFSSPQVIPFESQFHATEFSNATELGTAISAGESGWQTRPLEREDAAELPEVDPPTNQGHLPADDRPAIEPY